MNYNSVPFFSFKTFHFQKNFCFFRPSQSLHKKQAAVLITEAPQKRSDSLSFRMAALSKNMRIIFIIADQKALEGFRYRIVATLLGLARSAKHQCGLQPEHPASKTAPMASPALNFQNTQ